MAPTDKPKTRIKLSPQELMEALKLKRYNSQAEFFNIKGNRIPFEPDIFDQVKTVLRQKGASYYIRDEGKKLDINRLVDSLESDKNLASFKPQAIPEEEPSQMEDFPAEEAPGTMENAQHEGGGSSSPFGFGQQSGQSNPARVVVEQKPYTKYVPERRVEGVREYPTRRDPRAKDVPRQRTAPNQPTTSATPSYSTKSSALASNSVNPVSPGMQQPLQTPSTSQSSYSSRSSSTGSSMGSRSSNPVSAVSAPPPASPSSPSSFPSSLKIASIENLKLPYSFKNSLKNLASSGGRFFKANIGKYLTPRLLATGASTLIGGILGRGVAGNVGALAGAVGGAAFPSFIKAGGGNILGNIGNGIIDRGARFSSLVGGTSRLSTSVLGKKTVGKRLALGALIGFIGLSLGVSLIGSLFGTSGSNSSQATSANAAAAPLGSIASCTFTRSGSSQTIKSQKLVGWINDASAQSGISPAILASIAMHENPGVLSYDDNNQAIIDNRYCVNGSSVCVQGGSFKHDGVCTDEERQQGLKTATAKGLMQLIDIYNSDMSEDDLCNIQKNIQRGAQIAKSKVSGLLDNESDIKKAICRYYGVDNTSCLYPDKAAGPYDYGQEAWQDFQHCQSTTNTGSGTTAGPVPQEKLDKIIYWDKTINQALEPGNPADHFNRMVQNITSNGYTAPTRTAQVAQGTGPDGIYWCTNSVIDSYNLSGISGLGPQHQAVRNMLDFWKTSNGYKFVPYNGLASLKQVQPGYALFRVLPNDYSLDHVSIVNTISIDQRGNGSISTLDSNSKRSWSSTIENGQILETFFDAGIVGFGGIE